MDFGSRSYCGLVDVGYSEMSEHTPGPWTYVPRHICEGEPEVRAPEGWLICCTASDEDAQLIAAAPAWKARAEAAEARTAEACEIMKDMERAIARFVRLDATQGARIAELEARLARVPDREAVARAMYEQCGAFCLRVGWDDLYPGERETWAQRADAVLAAMQETRNEP